MNGSQNNITLYRSLTRGADNHYRLVHQYPAEQSGPFSLVEGGFHPQKEYIIGALVPFCPLIYVLMA